MKIKTTELQGEALNRAVAKAKRIELSHGCYNRLLVDGHMSAGQKMLAPYNPSTDWEQGGPIIERERISIEDCQDGAGLYWEATRIEPPAVSEARGPTPLIAAMRCYVASVLGDEVEVPDEIL